MNSITTDIVPTIEPPFTEWQNYKVPFVGLYHLSKFWNKKDKSSHYGDNDMETWKIASIGYWSTFRRRKRAIRILLECFLVTGANVGMVDLNIWAHMELIHGVSVGGLVNILEDYHTRWGVAMVDSSVDARDVSPLVQIISLSCRFWQTNCKIID